MLGNKKFAIKPGGTICIAPATPHGVENTVLVELRILCCHSPPYSHDNTEGRGATPAFSRREKAFSNF